MSVTQRDEFGSGITMPLEQDGQGDFRSASGLDLLKNDVMSLLAIQGPIGKTPGEVPWDTDMGGNLDALRHRGMHNEVVEALAYEASAGVLERYEARARITDIKIIDDADKQSTTKRVKVFFVPVGQGNARTESIELPLKE